MCRCVGVLVHCVFSAAGEHAAHRDWRITHRPALAARLRDGWIAFNRSLADQSYKDVQSGQFVLHRFSTLRQAVASVRLGLVAWRASGYGALADELLTRGGTTNCTL